MKHSFQTIAFTAFAIAASLLTSGCASNQRPSALSSSGREISHESHAALRWLYGTNPKARALGSQARAVMVFPKIIKGGFMVGGMAGNGALIRGGSTSAFYQTAGLSYGMQAGIQSYGYALFFMDEAALRSIDQRDGWEIGSAPSLVVLDQGMAGSLSTTTINKGIYAVFFNQQGLMGGLGLQGSKITRIHPNP
ncbi:MAG: twin-arginine translocation pathway signal protein [Prosthecobacter sp.]|jgi:lipid-binding SYLF domain-containing protein|uniref:lipid-binding SYLF domain-containing protein n=1 Tax=Prosthecobacter sp. TaxID=1965333 RepID=UPI0019DC6DA1|nr:YSC84-related protein [Prosthecobacter sp.]MBE2285125.1 twin-arginine translocation pathway signal protein [Prosthecobacter sp.]